MPDDSQPARPLIVLAGVSGVGKTTVGRVVARLLSVPFSDADDYHSDAARALMADGIPLTDADRAPWLARLAGVLAAWHAEGSGGVLACSALTPDYRRTLSLAAPHVRFVHLTAAADILADRLSERSGHFFPPDLLQSQLDTLDATGVPSIDAAAGSPNEVAQSVVALVRAA